MNDIFCMSLYNLIGYYLMSLFDYHFFRQILPQCGLTNASLMFIFHIWQSFHSCIVSSLSKEIIWWDNRFVSLNRRSKTHKISSLKIVITITASIILAWWIWAKYNILGQYYWWTTCIIAIVLFNKNDIAFASLWHLTKFW